MVTGLNRRAGLGSGNTGSFVSREEHDFIDGLFVVDGGGQGGAARLTIEIPEAAPALVELLRTSALHLEAVMANWSLRFKPRLADGGARDEARLVIGYPEIVDREGHARSHRVENPPDEIRLIDDNGRLQDIRVLNISASGMAVRARVDGKLARADQKRLRLRIGIPAVGYRSCDCAVVRIEAEESGEYRLGLRFTRRSKDVLDGLTQYLFSVATGDAGVT